MICAVYTRCIPPEEVSVEPPRFRLYPVQYPGEFERGKRTPAFFRRRILCGLGKPNPHHRYRARARAAVSFLHRLHLPRRIKWVAAVKREHDGMRILGTESCINSRSREERRKCLVIFAVR